LNLLEEIKQQIKSFTIINRFKPSYVYLGITQYPTLKMYNEKIINFEDGNNITVYGVKVVETLELNHLNVV
jgi:hypothetical protein